MTRIPSIAKLLETFFRHRLIEQRNASPMTIASYRDALRLLIIFASERTGRNPCQLEVSDLDRELVLDFLAHLERQRGNQVRTRNARLTAIRSFFRHVAYSEPQSMGVAQRILEIPSKRTFVESPRHLESPEIDALLRAPDRQSVRGRRDHALLLFLARTGARVSEAIGVDAADLRLQRPHQVLLRGKGRKHRLVPLSADLAECMAKLCREIGLGSDERSPIFQGVGGGRLTRFGATHVLRRAVKQAAVGTPTLLRARVSPHLLRHSLAMRLLQSGSDLVTIQAWLGHASVSTTHRYASADVEMMRKSLELAKVTPQRAARFKPKDAVLAVLESL